MKFNDDRWESPGDTSLILYEDGERKRQKKTKGRIFVTLIIALLLVALVTAALCFARVALGRRAEEPAVATDFEEHESEWQGVFASRQIGEDCLSVCVSLRLGAVSDYGAPSATGVVISSDGWILTCDELLSNTQIGRYYAKFYDGREYAVEKVKRLGEYGLMKIDAEQLSVAQMGDLDQVCAGQSAATVSSLGAPYHELAIRQCVLSGFSDVALGFDMARLLRTDIEFDGISVGSPVFDSEGRVLGIALYENQKFILPIDQIRDKIEMIK